MYQGNSSLAVASGTYAQAPPFGFGAGLQEIAHDARSMVTALGLYCELLAEAGVLAVAHRHYLDELRLLAAANRQLVEKLTAAVDLRDAFGVSRAALPGTRGARGPGACGSEPLPPVPIANLAAELRAQANLLDAMAGAGVAVTVRTEGGELPARITGEDLTRVLVNLVKNAAEAMKGSGSIEIALRERRQNDRRRGNRRLVLTVEDSGPGIGPDVLDTIFEPHFTTAANSGAGGPPRCAWPSAHRGLGLSIARSLVELAGGRIAAGNRRGGGARFTIELPAGDADAASQGTRSGARRG
jgi:signal transduction histidine kinase